jgi:peptidoglycan/xylan/chitin deacetylase (PgdA/CDA1 family)
MLHAVLCFVLGLTPVLLQPAPQRRTIALTFDDLPYVDAASQTADGLVRARRVTDTILRVLDAHQAPAVGFVTENKLSGADRDARIALLERWIEAGAVLGNHTYSHPDFNALSIEAFEKEILDGEVVTRRLMKTREPYPLFFRHPQTHTGDTPAKKEAIERFLAGRVYLDFAVEATAFAERVAPEMFGRDIPQTLLVHANDITADTLDDLLDQLERRGYRFVSLEDAMRDAAYGTPDTLVSRFGPTWLWRWRESLGLKVSFKGDPEVPQWVTDAFNNR